VKYSHTEVKMKLCATCCQATCNSVESLPPQNKETGK